MVVTKRDGNHNILEDKILEFGDWCWKPPPRFPNLRSISLMTKESTIHVRGHRHHHWVVIDHKRGVAYACIHCGKVRYYGRHKKLIDSLKTDQSIMVYLPVALALPHGVMLQTE